MVHLTWALAVTAIGLIGVTYLGWALTHAIWTGRSPRRVPLSASILLALATMHVLAGQRPGPAPALIAAASVEVAPPSCIAARGGATSISQSGERVTLTGSDRVRADCALWAIIFDPRTGDRWAQGPALVSTEGWSLTLVLGTGQSDIRLPYLVEVSAFEPEAHLRLREGSSSTVPLTHREIPPARDNLVRSTSVEIGSAS